jgi:small nuclear ribonucleoprotein (snRNP)-like protein
LKKLLLFLLILAAPGPLLPAWAQLDQMLRLEIDPPKGTDNLIYDVTPIGDKGLLVSTQPRYTTYGNDNYWTIARYDTSLTQVWEKRFDIDKGMQPSQVYQDSAFLYVLLTRDESLKFKIFRMDYLTGEHEMIEGSSLTYVYVTDFKVLGNTAYLGGAVNFRPVVIAFNFLDKRSRVLPALYEPRSELVGIEIDNTHRVANIVVFNAERRQSRLYLKSFDFMGKITKNLPLESQKDKTLHTAKITSLNDSEQFVLGNYTIKNSPYSQGIYLAKLNNNQQEYIKYFRFNDFRSFFDYMKPRRRERVKNRISRLREKGREMQLHYRFLMHDLIETKDQYIVVAEAYFPQYRSNSVYGFYPVGMRGNSYYDRIFDGYRYTHAVVCGFDKSGNLLWDNCFEILDYKNYQLREIVEVAVEEDKIVLAYPEEGTVHTKVIRGNDVLKSKEKYTIKTNFENDRVTNAEDASIDHWYGPYFISWGFQEIYNGKDTGVKPNREVFYLNKLTYHSEASTLLPEQK